jgi:S-adenosylmethionine hydrolase
MPTASRQVRKIRRIKRERNLALRAADIAFKQRDLARRIAAELERELQRRDNPDQIKELSDEEKLELSKFKAEDEALNQPSEPAFTLTKLEDEEVSNG